VRLACRYASTPSSAIEPVHARVEVGAGDLSADLERDNVVGSVDEFEHVSLFASVNFALVRLAFGREAEARFRLR
jgi:hypothetical protein